MAMKRTSIGKLFILAFLITVFLLVSILFVSSLLENKRESYISDETQQVYNSLNEMQIFLLMSETYGQDMACLAFDAKLKELDKTVWSLGQKIDQYRVASEEFRKNPYYQAQKHLFNENEVFYMMLLQKLKKECSFRQAVIAYFYQNSADCTKCDDQAYVLSDINRDIDPEVAIFSFDHDLNLTTVNLLERFYNVTQFPCVVIDDQTFCGIRGKAFIEQQMCLSNPEISLCANAS